MKAARLFLLFFVAAAIVPARGTTLNVTSTADSGAGTLRAQMVAAANGDTVAIAVNGTINLTSGEIAVSGKNLTITGPGANNLTITTSATTRALHFTNAACTISGITFSNCKGMPGDVDTGGALLVDNFTAGGGTNVTVISDCAFTNNQSGWGGAVDIFNGGLTMNRCTFSGNTCTGLAFGTSGGGGALSLGPTVSSTITNCTFSGNTQNGVATGQPGGGAIYNYGAVPTNPAPITVEHCTFVGNVDAAGAAGAIRGSYTGSYHTFANVKNSLLVNNQAPANALKNFAGKTAGALTLSYSSLGGNVTDETVSSMQFMPPGSDVVGSTTLANSVSPTLALNGGVTKTHALARGSVAQSRGTSSLVAVDQRGAPRHANPDSGAFELIEPELSISVAQVPVAENGTVAFGSTPFDAPVTRIVQITNSQTSTFTTGPLLLAGPSVANGYLISGFPTTALANGETATFNVTLAAINSGLFNGRLTFTGNDRFNSGLTTAGVEQPNQHTLNLAGLVTDTMDHWRQQYFGPGSTNSGAAADTANPAGDGMTNLLKYSLGLNPLVAYPPGTGIATGLDLTGHLTMTVTKNPAATDLTLAVQVSGNLLLGWDSFGTTIDENTPIILKAHDNTSIVDAPTRFIRLEVARP